MEISATDKRQRFPFPAAAIFFIGYSVLNLTEIAASVINGLILTIKNSDIHYLKNIINIGSFVNVIFSCLILTFAIILIMRKLNIATSVATCGIAALFLINFFLDISSFINFMLTATGAKNIFVLLFGLPKVIGYILEAHAINLLYSAIHYTGKIFYLFAFILLIPIAFMSQRKNRSKLWNIACITPCVLAVFALGSYVISYVIIMLSSGAGAYYVFCAFMDTSLTMGIIFCCLWFSSVFKIQREAASNEDENTETFDSSPAHAAPRAKPAFTPVKAPAKAPEKAPANADQKNAVSGSSPNKSPFIKDSSVPAKASVPQKKTAEVGTADELMKYKALLDSGAITYDEYNEIKKRLLNI